MIAVPNEPAQASGGYVDERNANGEPEAELNEVVSEDELKTSTNPHPARGGDSGVAPKNAFPEPATNDGAMAEHCFAAQSTQVICLYAR